MSTEQRTRSSDGTVISYEVAGSGSPFILFVHGFSCNRGVWREQIKRFSPTHTVAALDLAGHGTSDRGRKDWTIDAFADDVLAVVSALEPDRFILVGHSMGGIVVAAAAATRPSPLIGVVAADSWGMNGDDTPEKFQDKARRRVEGLSTGFSERVRSMAGNMVAKSALPEIRSFVVDMMGQTPAHVGIPSAAATPNYGVRFREALTQIEVPRYAIQAESTRAVSAEAESLGVRTFYIDGVGHFVMLEDPAGFNSHLLTAIENMVG